MALDGSVDQTSSEVRDSRHSTADRGTSGFTQGTRENLEFVDSDSLATGSRMAHPRSLRSGNFTNSLRKYASYHSGMTSRRTARSLAATTASNVSDEETFTSEKPAPRMLRRRPGGNLKEADNVHDLMTAPRPRSTGSLSNRHHSVSNSMTMPPSQLSSIGSESTSRTPQVASTSIMEPTDRPPLRKSISLVDTHSSQQNLRPSFEAEVAKLAALPDFEGDGGVEAALLKLEGRLDVMSTAAPVVEPHEQYGSEDEAKHHHREDHFPEGHLPSTPSKSGKKPDVYQPTGGLTPEKAASRRRGPPPPSIAFSEDSYNSVPLLERGLSGRPTTRRGGSIAGPEKVTEQSTPRSARFPVQHATGKPAPPASPVSSFEHVEKTESLK
ncbi:hypothetical protein LTS18_012993, partial [Coniosporium uncinatum]